MEARVIGEFFVLCEDAQTEDQLANALFEAARRAGFSYASYLFGDSPAATNAGIFLTNFPSAWQRRYKERCYHRIDPIISRARRTLEPFIWDDPLVRSAMSPRQLRMMEEAKTFGVGHGFAVPLHSSVDVGAACLFACEHNDIPPLSCKAMQRISLIAHEHICRVARVSDGRGAIPQLSGRERACLNLYARGLGDSEIADALGIRLPTVRRHLDQARLRLEVTTRPEALVRALLSRQIDPGGATTMCPSEPPVREMAPVQ